RARFCEQCRLNVYNLSEMSAAEAAALVREKEGRLCVRYYARPDGTMLTRDCPVGFRAARRLLLARMGTIAAAFVALLTTGRFGVRQSPVESPVAFTGLLGLDSGRPPVMGRPAVP